VTVGVLPAATPPHGAAFAHASEAELARILDFYEVRWRYEPDTFPIGWSLDGHVVESFAPDFYLPDLELYLELTTLKQKLVRKKNRKLRRLRELYPDIRIKLFYARDFRMLMLKFGRLALADELSGTVGQSTPPRLRTVDAIPVMGVSGAAPAADEAAGDAPSSDPDALAAAIVHASASSGRRRGRRRRAAARAAEAARQRSGGQEEPA
jgi:hypoxanthine phosphoribosyltransferase